MQSFVHCSWSHGHFFYYLISRFLSFGDYSYQKLDCQFFGTPKNKSLKLKGGEIMGLHILKRRGKEYRYFQMGSTRLYLGADNRPKINNVHKAIEHTRAHIKKCESELWVLEDLMHRSNRGNIDKIQKGIPCYKLVVLESDGVVFDRPWYEPSSNKGIVSTWDFIFKEIGIYDMCKKLKERYERGEFNYVSWTVAACEMLKIAGLKKEVFEDIINRRPFFTRGTFEFFKKLKELNVRTALVTGTFLELAKRAQKELDIDEIEAHCEFKFSKEGFLESWELYLSEYDDKLKFVEKIAMKHLIPMDEVVYVGNEIDDINIFRNVGLAIAFNAEKPEVLQNGDIIIDKMDIRRILPYLFMKKTKRI